MIEWTDDLLAQAAAYDRAALSYPGRDGYPVTLPTPCAFDREARRFTLTMPTHPPGDPVAGAGAGQTSLTLLRYVPEAANVRYLLWYGRLAAHGGGWAFTPSRAALPRWTRGRDGP